MNRTTLRTAVIAVAAVAGVRWIAQRVPQLSFLRGVVQMRGVTKDLAFWGAVMLAGVAGVGLFKMLVARLPVPDGLNRFAAAL